MRDHFGDFIRVAIEYCEAADNAREQSLRTTLWTKMIRSYHDWRLVEAGLDADPKFDLEPRGDAFEG